MPFSLRFRCPLRELPTRDGQLYCASCDHTVTDLAAMTREDADTWLRTAPEGACVRVRRDRAGNRVHPVVVAVAAALTVTTPALAGDLYCAPPGEESSQIDFGTSHGAADDTAHTPTAELSAHALGWLDDGAVRDQVLAHPGPFRRLLEPLTGDDETATVVIFVRADGTVSDVRTKPGQYFIPEPRLERIRNMTFPASPGGGRIAVHYGPRILHLWSGDPGNGVVCRKEEEG